MTKQLLGWEDPSSRRGIGFGFSEKLEGTDTSRKLISDSGEGHTLVFAPTGKGKSRGVVIPNLLSWPGSAVVLDVKGELAETTAEYRRDELGQSVHILDPWRQTGMERAALNPLDVFRQPDKEPADQAFMLANMFNGNGVLNKDPFWPERAETLIAALLVAAAALPEAGTLGWVSDQLTDDQPTAAFCKLMERDNIPDFARRGLAGIVGTAEVTRQGIISTAQSLARPLMSESVKAACGASTFSLEALRDGEPMTIYIVVPPSRISSQASVLRLWLSVFMSAITDRRRRPACPTLFVLDEIAQLGHMQQVTTLLTLGRGYGCRAMLMFQSYDQLSTHYPDHLTLIENASAILTFGHNAHPMSAHLSQVLGDISPEALFRMSPQQIAIKLAGKDTQIGRRLDYLKDAMFRGRFAPNPMFEDDHNPQMTLFPPPSGLAMGRPLERRL